MSDDNRLAGDTEVRLAALAMMIARIETKLDVFIATSEDHEDRLRDLERSSWMKRGGLMLIGVVAGVLANILAKFGVHIG